MVEMAWMFVTAQQPQDHISRKAGDVEGERRVNRALLVQCLLIVDFQGLYHMVPVYS